VRTAYQGQGIGLRLTELLIESLNHLYMIDLLCEEDLQPFYEKAGMSRARGMTLRFYENQSGASSSQTAD
jgi:predicted N-acetyltransferase YhbS